MTSDEAIKRINDIRRIYARYVEIVTENENEALDMAIKALELQKEDEWTINQYLVPIENKQIPTISCTALSGEPTACKIVCTYTHSACKSEEYLNKYKFCPNCGARMESEVLKDGNDD